MAIFEYVVYPFILGYFFYTHGFKGGWKKFHLFWLKRIWIRNGGDPKRVRGI
jgi:hypothetical protein